jgi:hypothetical protein
MRARLALSVAYVAALAVALAFADLGTPATVGLMLAGWLLLAAIEWTAWHGVAHYGAGSPPAWRVPRVSLPPAQPLEQFAQGYPDAVRDEGATWIASPAVRDELLAEWPVAMPSEDPEDTQPA